MPLFSAIDVITMIAPQSFRSGRAFLTVKARRRVFDRKDLVEAFLGRLGEQLRIDDARPGEQDVDLALLAGDLGVEPVEIGEVGNVTLHCGDTAADKRYRLVQLC